MNVVTELLKSSLKLKPKIISLAECPLENGDWMEIKGYTCYANTTAEKLGCATYIKNEYVNMFVMERVTTAYVTLHTYGTEITIGYQRPTSKTWDPNNDWHKGSQNIVIGDLNAIHSSWSTGRVNTQGRILRRWLDTRPNLGVVNAYGVSYIPPNPNSTSSTIDLVIAEASCGVRVKHRTIASSEHKALEIKTGLVWRSTSENPLRYDKADWGKIETEIHLLKEDEDPSSLQEKLTSIILRHTPRASGRAKAFWNKDLTLIRKKLLEMVNNGTRGKELVETRRNFRKAIFEAKLTANEKALQEETDPECFRTVKMKTAKHPIPALQRPDGTLAAEHNHIAKELQDSLYGGEHRRDTPPAINPTSTQVEDGEIQKALKASPNGAATGPDQIPTRMLRTLWKLKPDLLRKIINQVYKEGMPNSWKTSSTILIPKANKPSYTTAKSWRPIQLQSILAKIMERIITNKLTNLDLLPDNMYGGRKNYGTTDAIQALDTFVESNKDRNVCITALDVEGGFDNLDLNRTCNTIGEKDKHLGDWIKSWRHHRQTVYRFNGRTSKPFKTDKGTPQGSPLSPMLFLISVKHMVSIKTNEDTIILAYVDDILTATAYTTKAKGQTEHQDAIDRLCTKAAESNYQFSKLKSEGIHIRTRGRDHLTPMMEGTFIPQKEELRWLGYFITENWNWAHHIKTWTNKAARTGKAIGALTSRYQVGGLNAWCTQRLIKGLIIPQLTYGIEVWSKKNHIKEAAKVLHGAMRNAFKLEIKTPTLAIDTELGIPPLDLYVKQRQDRLALRAHTLNRHSRMSNAWLETSNLPTIIANGGGISDIKAGMTRESQEQIDHEDIRYKGKPRAKYGHLRNMSRASFRSILYLRATCGWPYQATTGGRRKCPCGRDTITPAHLMTYCGMVKATKLGLHNNKTIKELVEWVEAWPDDLKDQDGKTADRAKYRTQVAGASINLPTSQPVAQDRVWRNGRWYIQCQLCPKTFENTKRERENHANTHKPGAKARGGRRGVAVAR